MSRRYGKSNGTSTRRTQSTFSATFTIVVSCILLSTGSLKIVSALVERDAFLRQDPILGLSTGLVFAVVGGLELLVGAIVICTRGLTMKAVTVAWLSTCALLYRLVDAVFFHGTSGCPCLGNFGQWLAIPSRTTDLISKTTLAILLLMSFGALGVQALKRRPGIN